MIKQPLYFHEKGHWLRYEKGNPMKLKDWKEAPHLKKHAETRHNVMRDLIDFGMAVYKTDRNGRTEIVGIREAMRLLALNKTL